jgi:two-component system response regulator AtoC
VRRAEAGYTLRRGGDGTDARRRGTAIVMGRGTDKVERILIVDDRALVLFVMERALEKLDIDCELVAVRSGQDALEALEAHGFDLVITDLKMPDMDGVELTEHIRARGSDAVVVWITAYGCHGLEKEAERLNVFRCVEKPLEVNLIRRMAREALHSG